MMGRDRIAFMIALGASVALHGAGGHLFGLDRDTQRIEGAAGSTGVKLGTGFADLVEGVTRPEEPDPDTLAGLPTSGMAVRIEPEPDIAEPLPAEPVEAETATEPPEEIEEELAEPLEVEPLAEITRPRIRPGNLEPLPDPRPEPVQTAAPPSGNSRQTMTRGSSEARAESRSASTSSGRSSTSTRQGNAAASNYPGKVQAKLFAAQRRVRQTPKGSAIVTFVISSNGALGGIGLTQSSGDPAFDQAALDIVRRAAPFPPPPPGAQTRYAIPIRGG